MTVRTADWGQIGLRVRRPRPALADFGDSAFDGGDAAAELVGDLVVGVTGQTQQRDLTQLPVVEGGQQFLASESQPGRESVECLGGSSTSGSISGRCSGQVVSLTACT